MPPKHILMAVRSRDPILLVVLTLLLDLACEFIPPRVGVAEILTALAALSAGDLALAVQPLLCPCTPRRHSHTEVVQLASPQFPLNEDPLEPTMLLAGLDQRILLGEESDLLRECGHSLGAIQQVISHGCNRLIKLLLIMPLVTPVDPATPRYLQRLPAVMCEHMPPHAAALAGFVVPAFKRIP